MIRLDLHRRTVKTWSIEAEKARPTAVCPENNIVLVGVTPTLKKVEEDMARLDVDVSCVRATNHVSAMYIDPGLFDLESGRTSLSDRRIQ